MAISTTTASTTARPAPPSTAGRAEPPDVRAPRSSRQEHRAPLPGRTTRTHRRASCSRRRELESIAEASRATRASERRCSRRTDLQAMNPDAAATTSETRVTVSMSAQHEFHRDLDDDVDWFAQSARGREPPLSDGFDRALIEAGTQPSTDGDLADCAVAVDHDFEEDVPRYATPAGVVGVPRLDLSKEARRLDPAARAERVRHRFHRRSRVLCPRRRLRRRPCRGPFLFRRRRRSPGWGSRRGPVP